MKNNFVLTPYLLIEKILSIASILSIYEVKCMKTNFCHRRKIATNYLFFVEGNTFYPMVIKYFISFVTDKTWLKGKKLKHDC